MSVCLCMYEYAYECVCVWVCALWGSMSVLEEGTGFPGVDIIVMHHLMN